MERLFRALAKAADGALVVDASRHVIFWNTAAQALTGFSEDEVRGRSCFALLGGTDEQGRIICHAQCGVAALGLSGQPVASFDTAIRTRSNGTRWVTMSTFMYPVGEDAAMLLVHLFRDATRKKQREQFMRELEFQLAQLHSSMPGGSNGARFSPSGEQLTPREREVLALLVRGQSTDQMAQTLVVSPSTVRNHIRHILGKFDVHSRLEAVAYALQHDLVEPGND